MCRKIELNKKVELVNWAMRIAKYIKNQKIIYYYIILEFVSPSK